MHFRIPSPITLWDDGGDAVVQVWWFACRISRISYFADHRFFGDESAEVCIYLTHVGIVVKAHFRTEYHHDNRYADGSGM